MQALSFFASKMATSDGSTEHGGPITTPLQYVETPRL
jgi:hypothetical protein